MKLQEARQRVAEKYGYKRWAGITMYEEGPGIEKYEDEAIELFRAHWENIGIVTGLKMALTSIDNADKLEPTCCQTYGLAGMEIGNDPKYAPYINHEDLTETINKHLAEVDRKSDLGEDKPKGMNLNFNNLRLKAAIALSAHISYLNTCIMPEQTYNSVRKADGSYNEYRGDLLAETGEMMPRLEELTRLMNFICIVYMPGNDDIKDISDDLDANGGITIFNPEN